MLLILQIILTVAAWRKGWRWRALIPGALGLAFGFFIGLGIGSSGGSIEDANALFLLMDLAVTVALVVLAIRTPGQIQETKMSDLSFASDRGDNDGQVESLPEEVDLYETSDNHSY